MSHTHVLATDAQPTTEALLVLEEAHTTRWSKRAYAHWLGAFGLALPKNTTRVVLHQLLFHLKMECVQRHELGE